MKKLFFFLLVIGFTFATGSANAQFRSIPGIVTDSFKLRYPNATTVDWSDKVTSFQATFNLDKEKIQAWNGSKGEWLKSEKTIPRDAIPAAVKDGLSKSKWADPDWKIGTVTVRYLPGDITQYNLFIYKNDITRRNLLFSSQGQLLKDGVTL